MTNEEIAELICKENPRMLDKLDKIIAAIDAGSKEALKQAVNHPAFSILVEMRKGWENGAN